MKKNKTAIVTGGAGFIGSHLVDLLIKKGFQVIVIDNLSSGRKENIAHHLNDKNFSFHKLDLSDYQKLPQLKKIFAPADYVFHLAALADIVPSIQKPIKYFRANVDGTINVLEAARKSNLKKLVYTASSSCYGIAEKFPTPENSPIQPEYPYALTKYLGEQAVLHWGKVYKMPIVSLRLFNVYGPRSRTTGTYGAVFGVFLAQKIHRQPFTIVGDGNQKRDFTFVTDVAEAFYQAALSKVKNEIINIGTGKAHSINELVKLLKGKTIHIPERPGEPKITLADISKAKTLLGYRPKISFEKGVKIMLDHLNDWQEAPLWTPKKIKNATEDWFKYLKK